MSGRPRLEIELKPYEPVLRGVRLDLLNGVEFRLDQVVLDTGSAIDLIGPQDEIGHILDGIETWPGRMCTVSGEVPATVFDASLAFLQQPWDFPIQVYSIAAPTRWLLGFSVLKHFDLCFRPDEYNRSFLVGPPRIEPLPFKR